MMKSFLLNAIVTILATTSFPHAVSAYDKDAEIAALNENRSKWLDNSGGTLDYDFQFERICYCQPDFLGPFNIEVRGGVIQSVTYDFDGSTPDSYVADGLLTIDEIFSEIEDALNLGYFDLDVTYDSVLGFPASFYSDQSDMLADDMIMFIVSNVQILSSSEVVNSGKNGNNGNNGKGMGKSKGKRQ